MSQLTLRSIKGSPLTNAEVDQNFINLNEGESLNEQAIQALVNTVASLSTSQAQIQGTTPLVIPVTPAVGILDFSTVVDSTNTDIFEIDAVNNLFIFKQKANFVFQSNIEILSDTNSPVTVTFNLVDNVTNTVLTSQVAHLSIAKDRTTNVPLSTLLVVTTPIKTVRVDAQASIAGYTLVSFSSVLTSSSGYGSETVESIDSSLGSYITETLL